MGPLATALSFLMISFAVTSILIIPFINLLYRLRFQKLPGASTDAFGKLTPVFNAFHKTKAGVPIGGGLLIIVVVTLLFGLSIGVLHIVGRDITSIHRNQLAEVFILLFTFISFGLLGLYDDIKKFFNLQTVGFFGMRLKQKLVLQILLSVAIATMMFIWLGIDILNIPFLGTLNLGVLFIPLAAFIIVAFSNAVNITDGLDGLAPGILMISLFALWFLSASILDVPLTIFIALWLGSIISFLYFNVFPARIFLGDVGSLAFGATLAVIGLLLGKVVALNVIGFIFVLEITSSFLQLMSKKFRKRKLFPAAPIHLTLQAMGWEEPKIVQRAWLVQIMLTIFGLWLAVL